MTLFSDNRPIPAVQIHYRNKIGLNSPDGSNRLLRHFLKPWNDFMSAFTKLEKSRAKHLEMPFLRDIIPVKLKFEEVSSLIYSKNHSIHRLLLDVGPMFDASPHDLKVYILAVLGVTAEEYKIYSVKN